MYEILLFAGTTEGRQIAEYLETQSLPACVFTATEYGGEVLRHLRRTAVSSGRMDAEAMEACFQENTGAVVIDATHPYAAVVSENLKKAARKTGCKYLRVLRSTDEQEQWRSREGVFLAESVEDAAAFLAQTEGPVLLTTGSKNLRDFSTVPGFSERFFARILSVPASLGLAEEAGLSASHILCMQGPFSREMNLACIRHVGAKWLVTKETGATGGFMEKLDAAEAAGCQVLVIGKPSQEQGISPEACIRFLQKKYGAQEAALIGTGCGADLTVSAAAWLADSDLVIGAKRVVEAAACGHADTIFEYRAEEIRAILREDKTHRKAAVLFSGDTGFYSGAAAFSEEIASGMIRCFPGISSLSAFAAKAGFSYEKTKLLSIHGRQQNIIGHVRRNAQSFCLLGRRDDVRNLCQSFLLYGMEELQLVIGEQLGSPDERILRGHPADFTGLETSPIAVLLIQNPTPESIVVPGLPDDAFIRGNVPMTKEEIRTAAISKLRLSENDTVYDIGAGTGSISVEIARLIPDGLVYAVEINPEGVTLIRKNQLKFGTDNLIVVEGHAPEAVEDLPEPDAVVIGGSKGTIGDLIRQLFRKNPSVRIVVTAITLETVSAVLEALRDYPQIQPEITQITVAKSRRAGRSHMMIGQNPISLISFDGPGE
ncbi:MAG: precorrin-6A reductase [Eubacterium sp.]|nr:precorrin-6A reductase [Eubacterium sp.]